MGYSNLLVPALASDWHSLFLEQGFFNSKEKINIAAQSLLALETHSLVLCCTKLHTNQLLRVILQGIEENVLLPTLKLFTSTR